MFADRTAAGRQLAEQLRGVVGREAVVLALPRGGIPVARPVAAALGAPLDVLAARKLGFPGEPELAIGAVTARGHRVLHDELLRNVVLPPGYLAAETARQTRRAAELERRLRDGRTPEPLADREVVIVDDGIATGMTVRAAIADVRDRRPGAVIVAAPVIAYTTYLALSQLADRVVAVLVPAEFRAVGEFYRNFDQVEDAAAARLLAEAAEAPGRVPRRDRPRRLSGH
ncbi:MAG: phosphoribosyltransferase [Candidatus Sericytochromatia bacterium]|nr:phosphoribosyltransferase [Candidatus Tanganyikabacteria bacterium]